MFYFFNFFFIKFIGQASNSVFNRLGIAQVWWNNWHVNPIKRYYSNLLQRDFFLIKFIPLFFLYSIHISHYNFWGLSYFYILRNIKRIVSIYKRAGKFNTGVAIISNGSLENEQIIRGNISSILYNYEENPVPAPAIIVVGEVVNLKSVKEHVLVDEYLL